MNPFLKKILAATRLTSGGHLTEATAAIQSALAAKAAGTAQPPSAATRTGNGSHDTAEVVVLDGLVSEVDPGSIVEPGDSAPDLAVPPPERSSEQALAETPLGAPATAPPGAPPQTGRFTASSFTGASGTRVFKLFEPVGFEGRPLPLVVMLHGCTQDPDDFAAGTRMNKLAQESGFLVLYPAQAARSNANKCWNWFVPADQRRGSGEPALLAGMTRHVMQAHGVDPDRVFVAGLSAGAAMAAILAHEYPDVFAAAGVHSGLPPGAAHDVASAFSAMKSGAVQTAWPGAQMSWPGMSGGAMGGAMGGAFGGVLGSSPMSTGPMSTGPTGAGPLSTSATGTAAAGGSLTGAAGGASPPAARAPLIVFHGGADSTVAPANGDAVIAASLGSVATEVSSEAGGAAAGRSFRRTVWRVAGAGSDAPSLAEQWLVHGAPHAWSRGARAGSYTDPAGPDASREMLRFFLEHPRRSASTC